MAKTEKQIYAFNRGIISKLGLARLDVDVLRFAAEIQSNWMPRVLGSMMLRPGWEYLDNTRMDTVTRNLPFVFSEDDVAAIELSGNTMFVRIDDALITRPAVTTAVTNGNFTSDLAGWTDIDEGGTTSAHNASGFLDLLGDRTNFAGRKQTVTTIETSIEHALRIIIERGPVVLKVGSTDGGDEYVPETQLGTGDHSLAFTPTGDFFIEFTSSFGSTVQVDSCNVEAAGTMSVPTLWGGGFLGRIRYDQSGDVVYVAARGFDPRKIERRATRSWSVVRYEPIDGPFLIQNVSNTTIATSALDGDVTLTASKGIFRSAHVGALFRIASVGQKVSVDVAVENTFSDPIRVVGVDAQRQFQLDITGTWVATVTVQYSIAAPGSWVDLETHTVNVSKTIDDFQDDNIIFYRVGVKTGEFTSGTATCVLTYGSGSISGVARITAVASALSASAVTLKAFGETTGSSDWWEGEWSSFRGFPSATVLYEGRLWWAGNDDIFGSISDLYESFDDEFAGDAGPITRNIGHGPIQNIHWLLGLGRLMVGTAQTSTDITPGLIDGNAVLGARSSGFDEPLTPTNFNLKSTALSAVYVDRTKQRLYKLDFDVDIEDYQGSDMSVLTPDLNEVGIVHIAVQMKPDIRIHCVLSDGDVSVLVFDRAEDVMAWVTVETTGTVEDVMVLPGVVEDQVYYVVKRNINSSDVRFIEKWALESECQGGLLNKCSDAHLVYDSTATTSITGLDHLEGEVVTVWADGIDVGDHTVASGAITLTVAASKVVVGMTYTAQFKSAKLATIDAVGLFVKRKIDQLGVVLHQTHHQGLQYGPDFSNLSDLPGVEDGAIVADNTIHADYDEEPFPFGGEWDTDSRICLQAQSPRPCTVLAVVAEVGSHK